MLIDVHQSSDINIQNFNIDGLKQLLFKVDASNISSILNVTLKNSVKTIEFSNSIIDSISNCSFINNGNENKSSGGALSLFNSEASIFNSTFNNNSAVQGGAISLSCTSLLKCKLMINETSFSNNSAKIKGGAIFYDYMFPIENNVTFVNNTASYGPNHASYPVRVGRVNSTKDSQLSMNDVGPGITLEQPLSLALIDNDDQVMVLDNESQLIILSKDPTKANVGGTNAVLLRDGIGTFDQLSAIAKPGSTSIKFSVSSTTLDKNKITSLFNTSDTDEELVMNFRYCQPGERQLENQ